MPRSTTSSRPSSPVLEVSSTAEEESIPYAASGQHDALQQLTSVLTRHLGTLTNTISGYADLLMDTPDAQDQREIALHVLEASSRIDDLLAKLRHYSHPREASLRPVAVDEVVEDTLHLLDEDAQKRIQTKVEPDAASTIEADPELLRQALINLLQNAVDATSPTDNILLRVTRGNDREGPASKTDFEVWNDGEIEIRTPSDVFRPFFSVHPQRLGLGLPIASHIAEQHAGTLRLTANSSEAGGTCFTLRV